MKPIRTCLVGLGVRGKQHLENLERLDTFDVVGVYDIKEELCTDVDWMEDEFMFRELKPEAIFISTPHTSHAVITGIALSYGIKVFCEKPAAPTVSECEWMDDPNVAIGFHHMGHNNAIWLKNSIPNLGGIREITITLPFSRPDSYYEDSKWLGRMKVDGQLCMDGVLMNQGIHFINQAMWLACPGEGVLSMKSGTMESALYKVRDTKALETDDLSMFRCILDGGIKMYCIATTALDSQEKPVIEFVGNHGMAWYSGFAKIRMEEETVFDLPDTPDYLYTNFFNFVRHGRPPFSTVSDAMKSTEVVEEAFKYVNYQIKDASSCDLLKLMHECAARHCLFSEYHFAPEWA